MTRAYHPSLDGSVLGQRQHVRCTRRLSIPKGDHSVTPRPQHLHVANHPCAFPTRPICEEDARPDPEIDERRMRDRIRTTSATMLDNQISTVFVYQLMGHGINGRYVKPRTRPTHDQLHHILQSTRVAPYTGGVTKREAWSRQQGATSNKRQQRTKQPRAAYTATRNPIQGHIPHQTR